MKTLCTFLAIFISASQIFAEKANTLLIITDDQLADSISTFNQILRVSKESLLGYIPSPNVDQLAKEGTVFTNASKT